MSERKSVNPHGFEEEKFRTELSQRSIELFNQLQSDTRQRVDTLAKSIFVLSGGALTVSLGIFLRDSAPILMPIELCALKWSFWGLFLGMAGFATIIALLIVQAFVIGENWRAQIDGKETSEKVYITKATVWANWIIGIPAFIGFLGGLGALAWLATSIISN